MFATERLCIRHLEVEDVDAMYRVYGDADAMRWIGDGQPLPREDCVRWVEVTHANYARRGYGMFTLTLRESGAIIGFCGLVHPGNQSEAEIKYALDRDYWRQGYATEAVRGLLEYGATHFYLNTIIATVMPNHHVSQRVLRKAGMVPAEPRCNDDGSTTLVFIWHAAESGTS